MNRTGRDEQSTAAIDRSPPAWFRAKSRPVVVNDGAAEGEPSARWFDLANLSGIGVSTLLHTAALLIFAFWFLPGDPPVSALQSTGDLDNGKRKPFDKLANITLKADTLDADRRRARANENVRRLFKSPRTLVVKQPRRVEVELPATTATGDDQTGIAKAGGGGVKGGPTPGKNAVEFGPFKVWPEPEAPAAKQVYAIWIRVKVPDSQRGRYSPGDLSGTIQGNDSKVNVPGTRFLDYSQTIPWDRNVEASGRRDLRQHAFFVVPGRKRKIVINQRTRRLSFPVRGDYAYIKIKVPGALAPRVVDIVTVRSKLWDIEHRFRLVFRERKPKRRKRR